MLCKQAETAEINLGKIRPAESNRVEKLPVEREASSARLQEVVSALRKNVRGCEEKMDKVADMLLKVKRLYEQARSRVVSLRAAELSELREKINKLIDEVEANNLELRSMQVLVAEATMLRKETSKHREISNQGEVDVAALGGLQEEVLLLKML